MEHTLRRSKCYCASLDEAIKLVCDEGGSLTLITKRADNWYFARHPLQGHQPRRSKVVELRCDITKDEGASFWRVTGWGESRKEQ